MKKNVRMKLSEVSNMKYDNQKDDKINELEKLEGKIRDKFNIKSNQKLIDIECYASQVSFNFSRTYVAIECDNRELTYIEKKNLLNN